MTTHAMGSRTSAIRYDVRGREQRFTAAIGLLVAIAAGACASPAATSPCASPIAGSVTVISPAPPSVGAPVAQEVAPSRTSLCWTKGRPTTTASTPAKDTFKACGRLDTREVARVEARVLKDFKVTEPPSKLVIDFGCDLAMGPLHDVFFEDGGGHGGSLRIVRFRRDDARVLVTMIDSSHYPTKRVDVRNAEIDRRSFDALVASSRVALLVKPHLVRLYEPGTKLRGGGFRSTRSFHLRLTLVDETGRVTDRRFTGYESSTDQEDSLPLSLATEPIAKLLASTAFTTAPATDDERRMFTERFALTISEGPAWWVRERYIGIAESLGTMDAVPSLVALVKAFATSTEPGADRTLDGALDAIAKITDWNPRVDPAGKARTPQQAAAAVLEECAAAD